MIFINKKNYFLYSFYSIYILIGLYLSITNGITVDEYFNHLHWQINKEAAISFIKNGTYLLPTLERSVTGKEIGNFWLEKRYYKNYSGCL